MFLQLHLLLVFIFVVLPSFPLHDVEAFVPFHLSVMPAGAAANDEGVFDFKLVDHIDQLDQRHSLRGPLLFSIPAPGGNVCLVIDERGGYHGLRDSSPPMGLPISDSGVVDTEVGVIEDILFGTRFNLSDGSIRGRFCPGGTAGPFLRVRRLLLSIRTRLRLLGRVTESRRHRSLSRSLEVLSLRVQPGGSLTVSLPVTLLSDEYIMGGPRRKVIGPPPPAVAAWMEECGLEGYCH